jgi:hypothetical protein
LIARLAINKRNVSVGGFAVLVMLPPSMQRPSVDGGGIINEKQMNLIGFKQGCGRL